MTRPQAPSAGAPPSFHAKYLLGVLLAAMVISLLDRQILSLLVEPIRHDLGLSDTQISLLQGLAFAALYAVMGIPFGILADRVNRRNLIACGVLVWSVSTILCGLSRNFPELFLARVGVGVGEACLSPAAYSLISDSFARERRGRALGLLSAAGNFGLVASLFLGRVLTG